MSVYAMAVMTGVNAIYEATSETDKTRHAYNQAYAEVYEKQMMIQNVKQQARDGTNASLSQLSAVKQDKVLSNIEIKQRQDEAEANAKVLAATAGVSGRSVDDVQYNIERNEAVAIARNEQMFEQEEDAILNNIKEYKRQEIMADVRFKPNLRKQHGMSLGASFLNTLGKLETSDWDKMESMIGE